MPRAGMAADRGGYHLLDPRWGVATRAGVLGPVELDQLGMVHVRTEGFLHGAKVGVEPVCGQLDSPVAVQAPAVIRQKAQSRFSIPLADCEGRDKSSLGIQSHENVLVGDLSVVAPLVDQPSFFLLMLMVQISST